jgi:hypothetical protein
MDFTNVDWVQLLTNWFPMLLLIGIWIVVMKRMSGKGGVYYNSKRSADALERIADALEKRR